MKKAIDLLDAPCPHCNTPGFNRIWNCGSIMISGEVVQSEDCKDYENTECVCGKLYRDFESCPICNEKICVDCEDWEQHHKENDE